MAPPTALAISTSSVQRLIKEEASYHRELKSQEARLEKLTNAVGDEDENRDWNLKQERTAIDETQAVFAPLRLRIADAVQKLEDQLRGGEGQDASEEEVRKAKEALKDAKNLLEH